MDGPFEGWLPIAVVLVLVVGDGSLLSQPVCRCWLLLQRFAHHSEAVTGFVAPAVVCGLGIPHSLPDEALHSWHISQAASSIRVHRQVVSGTLDAGHVWQQWQCVIASFQ